MREPTTVRCVRVPRESRGRPQTHLSPLERRFWALFGLLSLPRHGAPLGPVMRTDSRPLDDFLKVNSTASPSLRLRKPSMCSLLCRREREGERERGREREGSDLDNLLSQDFKS